MRRALAVMLGLAAATSMAGSAALAAQASPAPTSGPAHQAPSTRRATSPGAAPAVANEHFRIISVSAATRSSVLATGTFTAGGYQVSGPVTSLQATDTVVFPNGRFTVRRHITRQVIPLPTSQCEISETINGTLAIGGGTGAYRGMTGTGAFVQRISGVLPRSHGQCGGPMTVYQSITYEGATVRG
jgi:hypothetical protein